MKRLVSLCLLILMADQSMGTVRDPRFTLITSLYNERDPERITEYITCLQLNLYNKCIKKIHVIYDTSQDNRGNVLLREFLIKKNITFTFHDGRPTFSFIFNLVNEQYPQQNIIVSNADIYFNTTLTKLTHYNLAHKFLALTRWNVLPEGELVPFIRSNGNPAIYSQDTWIFQTPLRVITNADIELGTYHCDNRICYEAKKAGLTVLNPCLSIQCCHLHLSNKRSYEKVKPPKNRMPLPWSYLKVPLSSLYS